MFGLIQGVLLSPPPYASPDRLVLVLPGAWTASPTQGTGSPSGCNGGPRAARSSRRRSTAGRSTFSCCPDGSRSIGGMAVTSASFRPSASSRSSAVSSPRRRRARPKAPATGHHHRSRPVAESVQGRPGDRRQDAADQPLARHRCPSSASCRPGIRFLPDPASVERAELRRQRAGGLTSCRSTPDETQPRARGWNMVTRLRDGAELAQAQREIAGFSARQVQADSRLEGLTVSMQPVLDVLNREGRSLLLPLFGFVVLVFFVACVNVAGLSSRAGCSAIANTPCAPRWGLATASVPADAHGVRRARDDRARSSAPDLRLASSPSSRRLAITPSHAPMTCGSGGRSWRLALPRACSPPSCPAYCRRASGRRHRVTATALKGVRSTTGRGERRLLATIATVQIVFTVTLLAGAALLVRTAYKLAGVVPATRPTDIIAVDGDDGHARTRSSPFHTQVLERVAALPGVSHAAFVWGLPLTGNKWPGTIEFVGQPARDLATAQLAAPLDHAGLLRRDGHGPSPPAAAFTDDDTGDAPLVAMVNQSLAKVLLRRSARTPVAVRRRYRSAPSTIVGVVADTRTDALEPGAGPEIYLSFWQNGAFSKHLVGTRAIDPARALAAGAA